MKFSVLIVEDERDKLRNILRTLRNVPGLSEDSIETEGDAYSAKKRMQMKAYDLLILDIAIPPHKAEEVDLEGGLVLLHEVLERDQYHTPTHIIGLTGHDEIRERASIQLAENALSLIHYQLDNDEWKRQLQAGVTQRMAAKKSADIVLAEYDYDVAFICALPMEAEAVRANGWNWHILSVPHDDSIYYEALFTKSGLQQSGRAVLLAADRMGLPAAAAATMKLILKFKPRLVVMTGIMGGVEGRVGLGDLVVANPVWDWGSGKWTSTTEQNDVPEFELDLYQYSIDQSLKKVVTQYADDSNALFQLRQGFSGAPKHDISMHSGPVASGASVLASQPILDRIKEQHRKLLGIEMEAYGVFSAVSIALYPKPLGICIKTVVDFGNGQKNDKYQAYGAYTSAKAASNIVELFFE
jgi:nucleoside phosphorylase/CheY-like chemotaxis protein